MVTTNRSLAFIGTPFLSITLMVADHVTKMAGVELLGFDTSGDTEVVMRLAGSTGALVVATEAAQSRATSLGTSAVVSVMSAPSEAIRTVTLSPNTINAILNAREQLLPTEAGHRRLNTTMSTSPAAIGILETHGFTALLHATDQMVKAARVTVVAKEKIGAGLVTIVVQGDVAAVTAAIEAGREAVGALGKVIAAHVIARPHEDVIALLAR